MTERTICRSCGKTITVSFGIWEDMDAKRKGIDINKCPSCGKSIKGSITTQVSEIGCVIICGVIILMLIFGLFTAWKWIASFF